MKKSRQKILLALLFISLISNGTLQAGKWCRYQEATQMVTSYFDPATKLIYAIGAVVGLIGA
jgi:hypothetical protein